MNSRADEKAYFAHVREIPRLKWKVIEGLRKISLHAGALAMWLEGWQDPYLITKQARELSRIESGL